MVYSAHLWGRLILSHQFLITYSSYITDGVWYNPPIYTGMLSGVIIQVLFKQF